MLSVVIFFLLISSGSVLCSAVFNKKYEEVLPIACSAIVLILFGFGMFNMLEVGVIILCIMGISCYIVAFVWSIKHKIVRQWLANIFTMSFGIFVILCLVSVYCFRGKLLHSWDEFTHWGTVVKEMILLNDFGTNPEANLLCSTYPPGIGLFQYLLEKIYIWVTGNAFSEELLYMAYQIFMYAYLVPFIGTKIKNNIFYGLVSMVLIFLAPFFFYQEVYSTIYVDPLIGILAGVGLATVLWGKKDVLNWLQIMAVCSMLVLVKDAGILFAIIVAVTQVLVAWCDQGKFSKKLVVNGMCVLSSICLPLILWNIDVAINNANRLFSSPIDFRQLLNIVLHTDTTYRMTVWNTYWKYLVIVPIQLGDTGIYMNYFGLFLAYIVILYILIKTSSDKNIIEKKSSLIVFSMGIVQTLVYIIGLVLTYIFKFDENDALRMASYHRYINIAYLAMWILIVVSVIQFMYNISVQNKNKFCILILCVMVIFSPMLLAYSHVIERESVYMSMKLREPYERIVNTIETQTQEDDSIYFIAQESQGFESWILRYEFRKRKMNGVAYSLGPQFYEGDMYSVEKSPEEWMDELVENYDYVALYKLNDYFILNYAEMFEGEEIISGALYRVNKQTQTLELVE